jgi:protein-S-isoprenylcysteine O-methyltransferase Ste14
VAGHRRHALDRAGDLTPASGQVVPSAAGISSARRRGHDGGVTDAPAYRIWPPIALGVPLLTGLILTVATGDPFTLARDGARIAGAVLVAAFGIWNGWTLIVMATNRTAVLPGGATRVLLDRGPFRLSRNPLYVGLIVLDVALALLWPSVWALIGVPVGIALLSWGTIAPEERYLSTKFGADYDHYRRRVRRWL